MAFMGSGVWMLVLGVVENASHWLSRVYHRCIDLFTRRLGYDRANGVSERESLMEHGIDVHSMMDVRRFLLEYASQPMNNPDICSIIRNHLSEGDVDVDTNLERNGDCPWISMLSKQLIFWHKNGTPIPFPECQEELKQLMLDPDDGNLIREHTHLLQRLFPMANSIQFSEFLNALGPLSFMRLCFDIRITKGTCVLSSCRFPGIRDLHACFTEAHPKSKEKGVQLTVGARALAKHCHRDHDGFWGGCSGPVPEKNALAENRFWAVMNKCVWRNVHVVPIGKGVTAPNFEYRIAIGYGMRFQVEEGTIRFRGFLEPVQQDGHENGWVHGSGRSGMQQESDI